MIRSYLDILDRSKTGQAVDKKDWDMDFVVLPVRNLVQKYDLKWYQQHAVPHDDDLTDRLFQAGLELAAASGIYCISTGRVIAFSRDELLAGMRRMPQELQMGEGQDARCLFARAVMDERPPLVWAGNPGAPTPQELFTPCVMRWM